MSAARIAVTAAGIVRAVTSKAGLIAVAVVVVCILAGGAWCANRRAERAEADRSILLDTIKVQERNAAAHETAAEARVTDAIKNHEAREELTDALESLPDARPSDRRVALGCARLRRQGTPDADLPVVCGPPA